MPRVSSHPCVSLTNFFSKSKMNVNSQAKEKGGLKSGAQNHMNILCYSIFCYSIICYITFYYVILHRIIFYLSFILNYTISYYIIFFYILYYTILYYQRKLGSNTSELRMTFTWWNWLWWRVVRDLTIHNITIHNKTIRSGGIDLDEGWYITSQYIA